MSPAKHFLFSKTLWFNVAGALVQYGGFLPPKISMPAMLIGNLVLRLITQQPITFVWQNGVPKIS